MAPESERAKIACGSRFDNFFCDREQGHDGHHAALIGSHSEQAWTNTKPPTLTCSEVVERLPSEWLDRWHEENGYALCGFYDLHDLAVIKQKLSKLLTIYQKSWRERRVQELEELLAKHSITPEPSSTQLDTTKEKV